MESVARTMVAVGLGIAALGALVWVGSAFPGLRIGRLPGDIWIQREGFTLFVPLTTMVLAAVAATGILLLVGFLRR